MQHTECVPSLHAIVDALSYSLPSSFFRAAMRLVRVVGLRYRRAAEEEEREKERPAPPPPSHHSSHQFNSIKNKFFNELTHLPSKNLWHSKKRCVLLDDTHETTISIVD